MTLRWHPEPPACRPDPAAGPVFDQLYDAWVEINGYPSRRYDHDMFAAWVRRFCGDCGADIDAGEPHRPDCDRTA